MNSIEQAAREWMESRERERLSSEKRGDGTAMFDTSTINVVSVARAKNYAPILAAFLEHMTKDQQPVAWMFINEYGPSNGVIATKPPKQWDGWKKVPLYTHPSPITEQAPAQQSVELGVMDTIAELQRINQEIRSIAGEHLLERTMDPALMKIRTLTGTMERRLSAIDRITPKQPDQQ